MNMSPNLLIRTDIIWVVRMCGQSELYDTWKIVGIYWPFRSVLWFIIFKK